MLKELIHLNQQDKLFSLKAKIDKIDVDKLKTVPVDLSKLSNIVKNEVVKKTVYDKLVAKLSKIDTTGFILKAKYNTDKSDFDKKLVMQTKKILILLDFLKTRLQC